MKRIITFIALSAAAILGAQTPESEFKTFGEAMRAGKEFQAAGRQAQMATYKAWNAKKREEGFAQQKIWFDNYEKGSKAYLAAVKMAPDEKLKARAMRDAAQCIFPLPKRRDEALSLIKQVYELEPTNGQYVYNYTWMLANSAKYDECCAVAEKFLADKNYKKSFAVAVFTDNYLAALLRLKRFEDAKKINAEIVKIDPKQDRSKRIEAAEKAAGK